MILCLISSVRSTPYSSFKSSGNSKAIKSSSSQCGYQMGKSVPNLLFWIGPDRIIWGTDFPIWYPHWLLDDFMAFELPDDLKEEYGVDLTDEIKQRIIGTNIARLYGIDIDSKLKTIANDEIAQRKQAYVASRPATETGVAGTGSR